MASRNCFYSSTVNPFPFPPTPGSSRDRASRGLPTSLRRTGPGGGGGGGRRPGRSVGQDPQERFPRRDDRLVFLHQVIITGEATKVLGAPEAAEIVVGSLRSGVRDPTSRSPNVAASSNAKRKADAKRPGTISLPPTAVVSEIAARMLDKVQLPPGSLPPTPLPPGPSPHADARVDRHEVRGRIRPTRTVRNACSSFP